MGSLGILPFALLLLRQSALNPAGQNSTQIRSHIVDVLKRAGYADSIDRKTWDGTISKGKVTVGICIATGVAESREGEVAQLDTNFLLPSPIDRRAIGKWFDWQNKEGCELATQVNEIAQLHADCIYADGNDAHVVELTNRFWQLSVGFLKEFRAKQIDPRDWAVPGHEPPAGTPMPTLSWREFLGLETLWGWKQKDHPVNERRRPANEFRGVADLGEMFDWTVIDGVEVDYTCGMEPSPDFSISADVPLTGGKTFSRVALSLKLTGMTVGQFKQEILGLTAKVKRLCREQKEQTSAKSPKKIKFISSIFPGYKPVIFTGSPDSIGGLWIEAVLAHRVDFFGGDSSAGARDWEVRVKDLAKAKRILRAAAPRDGYVILNNSVGEDLLDSKDGNWTRVVLKTPLLVPIARKEIPRELRVLPKRWVNYFELPFLAGSHIVSLDYRRRYYTHSHRRKLLGFEVRYLAIHPKKGELTSDFQVNRKGLL
ncbi:MAG: hypothetical protein ACHQ50_14060 [Fimbriimonadales bacterium]